MPLLRSSSRPQAVECFFCLSPSVLPPQIPSVAQYDRKGKSRAVEQVGTKWNWQCGRCGCWNIRDEWGQIQSDHPAMHDSALNAHSFALRATPSTSRLPTASSSASTMFCHSCLANQTLIMNMLANYLPDDDDPTYRGLHADLPAYLHSLHSRYPPVCPSCQPAVDEALRKADQKAQVEAWGSALRRGQRRLAGDTRQERAVGWVEVLVWRLRGLGFWASVTISWASEVSLICLPSSRIPASSSRRVIGQALLALHVVSILWFAWDPHWMRRQREAPQGEGSRIGRRIWVRNMALVLALRFALATGITFMRFDTILRYFALGILLCEGLLFFHALAAIRPRRPVALRLVRPTQLSAPVTPTTASAVHCGYQPPISHTIPHSQVAPDYHPTFGQTSLSARPSYTDLRNRDEMEWEPASPSTLHNGGYTSHPPVAHSGLDQELPTRDSGWDNFGTGKQRMFDHREGQDETGLEGLLAGWGLTEPTLRGASGTKGSWGGLRWFKAKAE